MARPPLPAAVLALFCIARAASGFRIFRYDKYALISSTKSTFLWMPRTLTNFKNIRGGSILDKDETDEKEEEEYVENEQQEEETANDPNSKTATANDQKQTVIGDAKNNNNDETDEDVVLELVDDPTIDEDSSANVDRMEYADAYDEEEEDPVLSSTTDAAMDSFASSSGSVEWHTEVEIPEVENVENSAEKAQGALPTISEEKGEKVADEDDKEREDGCIRLACEISETMETIMRNQLGYTVDDIKVIRPEIASIIVAKMVNRPTEGLPHNWYKAGTRKAMALSPLAFMRHESFQKAAKKAVISLLSCAIVIGAGYKAGNVVDFSKVKNCLPSFRKVTVGPKVTAAETASPPRQEVYQPYFSALGESGSYAATAVKNEREIEPVPDKEHDHSVRPHEKLESKEPLDETWLDKLITAVERGIGKIFRARF